ncbi:pentapeptide repeat-containing protein [Actinocatenispora sera]|uniref:pentapeptide repeat-containing protein n=1 Tax=Actinocatenispora sera TaxID=390989 RepID=UPI0033E22CA1
MASFGQPDDLHGARFVDTDLRGARCVGANLSGAVLRGVEVRNTEIDAPWLERRANPWNGQYPETVRSCLHVIFQEEWEHLRYAVRDLDIIASPPE